MNFSAWAIRRPLPALMLFFVLCVAGLWGFHALPIARFTDAGRLPRTATGPSRSSRSPSTPRSDEGGLTALRGRAGRGGCDGRRERRRVR